MKSDLKKDFPIFNNNPDLVYLDSTATSLKPKSMINKLVEYFSQYSANIFRGVYKMSEIATEEYESTREVVAEFINSKIGEVVFTRNTTESLNLVAYGLGRKILDKGDEVITTIMEHHSNFVPWQQLVFENEAVLKVIDINNQGLLIDDLEKIVTKKTKIIALTYVSNVLGTINPIKKIINQVKKINSNIIVIIDAAQAIPHFKIDVKDLGCDFLAFSAHKMLGPTGVGVLWGKKELLNDMYPFNYGGEMISEVYLNKTIFKESPYKFEAGTPAIAEVIAYKEAIKYLDSVGYQNIREHEKELVEYSIKTLKEQFNNKIKIYGPMDLENRSSVIAFNFGKYHPHDIASILNEEGISVRAGNHCAMPLHNRLKINSSIRVSFYLYNNMSDIDKFIEGLEKAEKILS